MGYLCFRNLRGALIIRAEITPIKPDPGNAGVGIQIMQLCACIFLLFGNHLIKTPFLFNIIVYSNSGIAMYFVNLDM